MQVKCEYCGSYINDTDKFCNNCGAVNDNLKRSTDGTPKTIAELQKWYKDRNLPPKETTRFFIGENYKGAKAFGIYESEGKFIVYKNKADGTRAVRYEGPDEAYAVNEIYLKLKSEILNQKAHNINNNKRGNSSSKSGSFLDRMFGGICNFLGIGAFVIGAFMAIASIFISVTDWIRNKPYAGKYYTYNDEIYYCNDYVYDDWYLYDYSSRDYVPVSIPEEIYNNISDYRYDDSEEWDENIEYFEDTEMGQYVESSNESSSSSDSDYSWDSSDSWDSDSSDWDSDW